MDRFRIQALVKLIQAGRLNRLQMEAALKELRRKCLVYGNGCKKRGRIREAEYYAHLPEQWKNPAARRK